MDKRPTLANKVMKSYVCNGVSSSAPEKRRGHDTLFEMIKKKIYRNRLINCFCHANLNYLVYAFHYQNIPEYTTCQLDKSVAKVLNCTKIPFSFQFCYNDYCLLIKNVDKRIQKHNKGLVQSTKPYKP